MTKRRKKRMSDEKLVGILSAAFIAAIIGIIVYLFKILERPFRYIAIVLCALAVFIQIEFDSDIGMTVFFVTLLPMAFFSDYLRKRTTVALILTVIASIAWVVAYFTTIINW